MFIYVFYMFIYVYLKNKTKQNSQENIFLSGSRTLDLRRERVTRYLLRHDN